MLKSKKLLGVLAALAATAVAGVGTYAVFSAQNKNAGSVFSTGTLVLSNQKGANTACLSTGGGTTDVNSNTSCESLIDVSLRKPGDDSVFGLLTVKNAGSLAASAFKVFSQACTSADNTEAYHGTGDICGKVQFYLQQTDSAGTATTCLYGGGTATVCDFSDAAKTLKAFQTAYNSSSNGLAIGTGLGAGASAYFKVGVKLPLDADNSFQGRKATSDLTWWISQ
jgi:hypothetical protein